MVGTSSFIVQVAACFSDNDNMIPRAQAVALKLRKTGNRKAMELRDALATTFSCV